MYFRHKICKSTWYSLYAKNLQIIQLFWGGFFLELSLFIKMNTGCVTLPLFEKKSHH